MKAEPDHPLPPLPDFDPLDDETLDRQAADWVAAQPDPMNVWIFATASLLWDPDFVFLEQRRAMVTGWHRALCLYSIRYRGTRQRPGLVMGLAPGGFCDSAVFRLCPDNLETSAQSLWRREMRNGSYSVIPLNAETERGTVPCFGFAPNPNHPQSAIGLPADLVERAVRLAAGERGPNVDYVLNTVDHLDALGIHDPDLHALAERLRS